jgi:hypothetical protein
MHKRETKDYPVKGTDDKIKSGGAGSTLSPGAAGGERSKINQGTSTLADKSGFKGQQTDFVTSPANKRQGDFKPVKTAASSVTIPAFQESIFVNKPVISESGDDSIEIELLNGDIIEINEDIYNGLLDIYEKLNTGNREIFRAAVNEGADSFERVLDFVAETLGEEE